MNYAVEQRIRFIDFLLDHYGYINRRTLMEYFGTSPASVTRDFRKYRELAPDNMVYDITGKKAYYKTQDFKRLYS